MCRFSLATGSGVHDNARQCLHDRTATPEVEAPIRLFTLRGSTTVAPSFSESVLIGHAEGSAFPMIGGLFLPCGVSHVGLVSTMAVIPRPREPILVLTA